MTPAFRVQQIALPRYQVEYAEPYPALGVAARLREKRILILEHVIPGDVGGELVLDLALVGEALQVALFFRILKRSSTATALEWVARRVTDADLLELWIQAVELRIRPTSRPAATRMAISDADLPRVLETCRRALQRNPFTALKVHWTAGEQEITASARVLLTELSAVQRCRGLLPSVADLVRRAIEEVAKTREMVSTAEGRRKARATFVPVDQLRQAIELAISKADLARLRGDQGELLRARAELVELGVPVPR
ncbi:MAG: hypothetical protein ABJE95_34675 [Byssovorax sp.]